MGLSYDPVSKKWRPIYEKIDNKTDYPTNLPVDAPTNLPTDLSTNVTRQVFVTKSRVVPKQESYSEYNSCATKDYNGNCQPGFVQKTRTVNKTEYYSETENQYDAATSQQNQQTNEANATANVQNAKDNEINAATNESNATLNKENNETNLKNTRLNEAYDKTISTAAGTRGGDYVQMRDQIRKLDIDQTTKDTLENYYKAFYQTEKLQKWDSALGAKPQYGDFDPSYYKKQNPAVASAWQSAVANDDIDITQRYGENGYYLQHYTSQGKPSGLRGNAPEQTTAAQGYTEKKPTDTDLQQVRDLQLGVDTTTQTQRLLNIPEIAAEWEKARNGDPYWARQAKDKYLNPDKPDEFVALFRLSDRPEDKQVSLQYNVNAGYGVTQLEDAINEAVGEKATVDVKKFGALTQDALKATIAEMKKAKSKEQALSLLGGLGSFSEVMDINKELTNGILGDTGVGGMLSFMSGGKAEESLEKSLQNITGVKNNVTYNWQQWFDGTLKKKYEQDLELGYTAGEAKEEVKIQADFARNFIDEYLTPRFNTSRSMDEFVEYLDVRQEEQNPFQTQDLLNATNQVANLRAQMYMDQLKASSDRYFDSNFYFNPTGDKARASNYEEQASEVASDWDAAKKGDEYWAQQAYRFGVDINDKDAFARMHFQVKGQGRGYDGAEDILNAGKVQDEIYSKILPALKDEALKQGTVFGQFVTPEEFTDELLKGLDPSDKESWNEVLQRYGITDFKGTVEELKEYVMETLRTGSAQKIREEIKYLNEKRKKPTQERLGLTYIERPEDYKDQQAKPSTELYKTFQSAGYQGTEDEFYEKFFPDLDRSEQTLLTKAGSDKALKTYGLDMSDPFASLGTIESFFGEEESNKKETTSTKDSDLDSYFKLGLDDDEEEDYKSKTGSQILGEFTSMFKGL